MLKVVIVAIFLQIYKIKREQFNIFGNLTLFVIITFKEKINKSY